MENVKKKKKKKNPPIKVINHTKTCVESLFFIYRTNTQKD